MFSTFFSNYTFINGNSPCFCPDVFKVICCRFVVCGKGLIENFNNVIFTWLLHICCTWERVNDRILSPIQNNLSDFAASYFCKHWWNWRGCTFYCVLFVPWQSFYGLKENQHWKVLFDWAIIFGARNGGYYHFMMQLKYLLVLLISTS